MTEREDNTELSAADRRLVERLRTEYVPEPMTPAEQSAFNRRLWARIERPRRRGGWIAGLTAAAVAMAAWLALPSALDPVTRSHERVAAATTANEAAAWRYAVLGEAETETTVEAEDDEMLPDDYMVIASVFLGDHESF